MKKKRVKAVAEVGPDEILAEYDFSTARPNTYARHFTPDCVAVVLEPDVAKAFPTASAVNKALRSLVGKRTARKAKTKRP